MKNFKLGELVVRDDRELGFSVRDTRKKSKMLCYVNQLGTPKFLKWLTLKVSEDRKREVVR